MKFRLKSTLGRRETILIINGKNLKDAITKSKRKDFSTVNFSGKDLSGMDLSEFDLSFSDFSHSDLSNCNFKHANLKGILWDGANLNGANIDFSCLRMSLKSFNAKFDKRIFCQLLRYAICAGQSVDDHEVKKICGMESVLSLANQYREGRKDDPPRWFLESMKNNQLHEESK